MLKIGLTGGIASGKSLASQYFSELGIDIIDADLIAHAFFKPNSPHLISLREHFGSDIFTVNGDLIRKALGQIVFSNPAELKWLNNFTHPLVNKEMKEQLTNVSSQYVILDIPLLVDNTGEIPVHLRQRIDRVLVISTELSTQVDRIMKRDHLDSDAAMAIINNQSSWAQKLAIADDVIENNGNQDELQHKVQQIHEFYLKQVQQS